MRFKPCQSAEQAIPAVAARLARLAETRAVPPVAAATEAVRAAVPVQPAVGPALPTTRARSLASGIRFCKATFRPLKGEMDLALVWAGRLPAVKVDLGELLCRAPVGAGLVAPAGLVDLPELAELAEAPLGIPTR
jgi:hypothetical protein